MLLIETKFRLRVALASSLTLFLILFGFNNCTNYSATTALTSLQSQAGLKICSPGSRIGCAEGDGFGYRICSFDGASFGKCELNSCAPGFGFESGKCVARACDVGTSLSCVEEVQGQLLAGARVCDQNSKKWSVCQVKNEEKCSVGESSQCLVANGKGERTCDAGGKWGRCIAKQCFDDFALEQGQCLAKICQPEYSKTCAQSTAGIALHGVGKKTCNEDGSAFGGCQVEKCDSGFKFENGHCFSKKQTAQKAKNKIN